MLLALLSMVHLSVAAPAAEHTAAFAGRVDAGREFSGRMSNGLFFCLLPEVDPNGETRGWLIQIGPTCDRTSNNYAAVTPPLHGPNPILLDAWNFDADANAPQNIREFRFVLSYEDYNFMMNEFNTYTDAGKVLAEIEQFGRGTGTLTVTGVARHKTAKGESSFDWIQFRAKLQWPTDK